MVEPHKMVLDFARPSRPLSDAEVAKCEKMCEVIIEFLKLVGRLSFEIGSSSPCWKCIPAIALLCEFIQDLKNNSRLCML